jgi:diguanylate cyclase (GGDEF)-like protein/PAS domain S-box-containing protein
MSGLQRKYLLAATALGVVLVALVALTALVVAGAGGRAVWVLAGASLVAAAVALFLLRAFADAWRKASERVALALEHAAEGRLDVELDGELGPIGPAYAAVRSELEARTVSRDYLEKLLSSMSEAILVANANGIVERANKAAARMLGYDDDELLGKHLDQIIDSDDRGRVDARDTSRPTEGFFRRADGSSVCISYTTSEIRNANGAVECIVYGAQNIDDRKRIEQRIRYLARTDALTKVANRMQFQHLLQQGIARAKRANQYLALLYLDVDRFKDINDTFGHAAGDTSLEVFARRIVDVLPEGAIPGRLAGDEFAVIISGIDQMGKLIRELTTVANALLKTVGRPFSVQGEEIFMTTSIGIALYPRDGTSVIDLLRNADAALYQAKKAGGNCFEYYSTEMNTAAEERLKLKSKLRRAFDRDELRLHYQPKYSLRSGRIEGAEALIRWDLPERGLVFPSDFIPLAEETNLILQIGDWVLNKVCADYREWQRSVPSPCRVSVNLSLRQLQQQRFLEGVRNAFQTHGISPTCLELEITETTLMEDTSRTIRILDALYGMGLHLAIDDFGTGYSSLSALQQFPISTLKIDQSFVRDLAVDHDDAAIVRTIIQMAHSLKLEVVAEGVESQEQLDFLRREGCDYVQGHLFGDPVASDAFCKMLVAEAEGSGRYAALFV